MDFAGCKTIFTYGTLMQGFPNERVIDPFPHKNYVAEVHNMELYDVGMFPAMIAGDHTYQGELVVFEPDVDEKELYTHMDYLEGYDPQNPQSLYVRVPVTVYVDNKPVETEVYLWNHSCSRLTYINPIDYTGYRDYISRKEHVL